MRENLKPCPFCGNDKVTVNTKAKSYFIKKAAERSNKDTSNYTCRCTKCGAKGPLMHSDTEAAEAWNKRCAGRESFDAGWEYHKLLDSSQARLSEAVKVLEYYSGIHEPELTRPNEGPWGVNSDDFGQKARRTSAKHLDQQFRLRKPFAAICQSDAT